MKLRSVYARMLAMCPAAWAIFRRSLQLCCALLLLSLLLLLDWNGDTLGNYASYHAAVALYEYGQAVLLIGAVIPVRVEDLQGRGP